MVSGGPRYMKHLETLWLGDVRVQRMDLRALHIMFTRRQTGAAFYAAPRAGSTEPPHCWRRLRDKGLVTIDGWYEVRPEPKTKEAWTGLVIGRHHKREAEAAAIVRALRAGQTTVRRPSKLRRSVRGALVNEPRMKRGGGD